MVSAMVLGSYQTAFAAVELPVVSDGNVSASGSTGSSGGNDYDLPILKPSNAALAVPAISLSCTSDGVKGVLTTTDTDIDGFMVWKNTAAGWSAIYSGAQAEFVDKDVVAGGTYTYTARSYKYGESGEVKWSESSASGFTITYQYTAAVPGLDFENVASGIQITVTTTDSVDGYAVWRDVGGNWQMIYSSAEPTFVDIGVADGQTYKYTARTYKYVNGVPVWSECRPEGFEATFKAVTAVPELQFENVASGIQITVATTDKSVDGYAVWRDVDGSWQMIYSSADPTFVDIGVADGQSYKYTARTYKFVNGVAVWSDCRPEGFVTTFKAPVSVPELKFENVINGIQITVATADSDVDGYAVWRDVGGSWTMIYSAADPTFVDIGVANGESYKYTARTYKFVNGVAVWSDCRPEGFVTTFEAPVTVPQMQFQNVATGIQITVVSDDKDAEGYAVWRDVGGSWTMIYSAADPTFVDIGVANGESYKYTARTYKFVNGVAVWSDCRPEGFVTTFEAPVTVPQMQFQNVATGIQITVVSDDKDAEGYAVWRDVGGSWVMIYSAADPTFVDIGVANGESYKYTARTYKFVNGEAVWSECDPAGFTTTFVG